LILLFYQLFKLLNFVRGHEICHNYIYRG
jgi:hypothetical protein